MINTVIDFRGVNYWAWIATFYLVILTVQDIRNKRQINDRHNYVMLGITISLISHFAINLPYLLALVATVIALRIYLTKYKLIGEGDINALNWVFLGFGYINYTYLLSYVLIFILATIVYTSIKLFIFKYKKPTPFFTVILASFWFTSFIFGLY